MRLRSFASTVTVVSLATGCALLVDLGDLRGPGDAGDAGEDAPPADAPTDVAGPPVLTCTETQQARVAITSGDALVASNLRVASLPGGRLRVVVVDDSTGDAGVGSTLRAYTFDPHDVAATLVTENLATLGAPVFSLSRYGGSAPGFAAIFERNGTFYAAHLDDTASAWSPSVALVAMPAQGAVEGATFVPIDAGSDHYFVVYSVTSGATQTIWGGALAPGSGTFATMASFPTSAVDRPPYAWAEPALVGFGGQWGIVLTPQGANGPPPMGAPLEVVVTNGAPVAITPAANLNYFGMAFAPSVATTEVNAAFLVANLSTITASMHVGRVAVGAVTSFDPQSLPTTDLPVGGGQLVLDELFFVAAVQHWEVVGAVGEQFVAVAPTVDVLSQTDEGGMNFGWWDGATGAVRAYAAGAQGHLLGDVSHLAMADATFAAIVGSLATAWVAYVDDATTPQRGAPGDLHVTQLSCQP